jgi:hypothetical protein
MMSIVPGFASDLLERPHHALALMLDRVLAVTHGELQRLENLVGELLTAQFRLC